MSRLVPDTTTFLIDLKYFEQVKNSDIDRYFMLNMSQFLKEILEIEFAKLKQSGSDTINDVWMKYLKYKESPYIENEEEKVSIESSTLVDDEGDFAELDQNQLVAKKIIPEAEKMLSRLAQHDKNIEGNEMTSYNFFSYMAYYRDYDLYQNNIKERNESAFKSDLYMI